MSALEEYRMSLPVSSGILGLIFIICYVVITSKIIVHQRPQNVLPPIGNQAFRYSLAPSFRIYILFLLAQKIIRKYQRKILETQSTLLDFFSRKVFFL